MAELIGRADLAQYGLLVGIVKEVPEPHRELALAGKPPVEYPEIRGRRVVEAVAQADGDSATQADAESVAKEVRQAGLGPHSGD